MCHDADNNMQSKENEMNEHVEKSANSYRWKFSFFVFAVFLP